MKIRFKVEAIPTPQGFWEYVIALVIERLDILSRIVVQRWLK